MTSPQLHFVVPGPLHQLTGGYVYDTHMVSGLRALGWAVRVHSLEGRFPDVDEEGERELDRALAGLPDQSWVVIDGLAMGGAPEPVQRHGDRLRIVAMVHHPLAAETGLAPADQRRLHDTERRALGYCRGVIVTSPYTARGLTAYGVPRGRVRIVLPGTEAVPPAGGPPAGSPPVLLCVASVTPRKGHDVLVDALDAVREVPWHCVCVGGLKHDPGHVESVFRKVRDAELVGRIDFVGEREGSELTAFFRGASAFVFPSHYEGYGMALAEALAYGLPVVTTTGGAIPYTVPEHCGLLVPPGDAEAFASALRRLLTPGSELRAELAAAARRHAAELPDWNESARAFAAAVQDLVA